MESNEMKCFYRELEERKKYLVRKLWKEQADNEWLWYQKKLTLKEYIVRDWNIKQRIRTLEK